MAHRCSESGPTAPLVLVADDNADTRRMYGTYLRAVGYRVAIPQDGEEAVATARAVRPAAVVLDLSMRVSTAGRRCGISKPTRGPLRFRWWY